MKIALLEFIFNMKWLLLVIINISVFAQSEPCNIINEINKDKWISISSKIESFEAPFYLTRKELLSIVSPEYISYSNLMNELELILVKSNLLINSNNIDLSFGPFQMKTSFILNTLKSVPNNKIEDQVLKRIKNNRVLVASDIDYLNKIENQWKILRFFEFNNYKIYEKFSLEGLYTMYNRGGALKNKTIFSKIKCKDLAYEDWCAEFLKLLLGI
jgi:hypothetical protein